VPANLGRVVSGRANFGFWIERLHKYYEEKAGMRLYPGTLNVELPEPYSIPSTYASRRTNMEEAYR
jgi:riboflavin kinase, archaea type